MGSRGSGTATREPTVEAPAEPSACSRSRELADDVFAVLYGDSYLPIDYPAVWDAYARCGLPALMTVVENRDQWDISNAAFGPRGRLRYRKGAGERGGMTHIDYGLSVVSRGLTARSVAARRRERPGRSLRRAG